MTEFHSIFCCPFLPSVSIIEGMGGMGDGERWNGVGQGGVNGVEGGKNLHWDTVRVAMTPIQWPMTHQWATESVGANPGHHCPIFMPSIGDIIPAVTLEGQQNALQKSRHLTLDILGMDR